MLLIFNQYCFRLRVASKMKSELQKRKNDNVMMRSINSINCVYKSCFQL